MRAQTAVLAWLSLVYSQQQPPQCAQQCVLQAVGNSGCSDFSDLQCLCTSNAFLSSTLACVDQACSDINPSVIYAQQLCSQAGVPLPADFGHAVSSPATSGTPAAAVSSTSLSSVDTSSTTVRATSAQASSLSSASTQSRAQAVASSTQTTLVQVNQAAYTPVQFELVSIALTCFFVIFAM